MAEVVSFGCRMNAVEADAIAALSAGVPGVVVNTCAVTAAAEREARQAIARLHRADPGRPIHVTGCAAEIDPAAWAALPGVVRVVPNAAKARAASWDGAAEGAAEPGAAHHVPAARAGMAGRARAFLDVQQGCDHRCTFCIIPQGRGVSRSAPAELVVARLREMAAAGVPEVVLCGIDLASWGADLPGRPGLAALLRHVLLMVPGLRRLRLSSLDPVVVDGPLLDVLGGEERVMPHLHLSVQAGADLVLKRMRRRHSRAQVVEAAGAARAARPGLAVAADLIAGFPTETAAQFADTLDLVADAGLDMLHVFPFSARPGTPAARMPAVPRAEVVARAAALRAAGRAAAGRFHAGLVGRTVEVVAERGGRGHTGEFAPVRGVTAAPGTVFRGRVAAADADGIMVEAG